MISSEEDNYGSLHSLFDFLQKQLDLLGLNINNKKVREFDLNKDTSVTFLNLNLSKSIKGTKITLSKPFILKTLFLLKAAYKIKEELVDLHPRVRKDYRTIKYNQNNNIDDNILISTNQEMFKKYTKLHIRLKNLKSIIKSRVGYIKYNSNISYEKFLKKHLSLFGFKWSEIKL